VWNKNGGSAFPPYLFTFSTCALTISSNRPPPDTAPQLAQEVLPCGARVVLAATPGALYITSGVGPGIESAFTRSMVCVCVDRALSENRTESFLPALWLFE
jgi:hypothetical protein